VRLLSTLANSMSVALENARLFDETNRLLAETEQRAAELSIINSVGEAMAKQLDVDTVSRLVGDKVRDIFNAEAVLIMLHDRESDMLVFRYAYDKAEGGHVEANSFPYGAGVTSKIIQSRQPLIYGTDQEGVEMGAIPVQFKDKDPDEQGTESFMGVPIIIGEKVLGVISVQSHLQHAYQADDVRLLSTLAANMGVAIENARLFEETNRLLAETEQRAAELSIINSVGEAMAKQLDVDTVTQLVGDKVADIFNAEAMHIILHDQESDMLVFRYGFDKSDLGHREAKPFPFGEGITTKIIQSRKPLRYGTHQEGKDLGAITVQHKDKGHEENEQDTEAYMGVPIIIGEKVLGVISVQSYLQHAYQDDDLRLLSTLAANMGVAIENARLFEETQRRATEMAALTDIGRDISATLDLGTVLNSITTNASDLLAAQTSAVIQLEPNGETLKPIAVVGENAEEIKAFNWKLGQGIIGSIVESGRAEKIEDAAHDPRAIHISGTDETEDIERIMVAPLTSKEGVSGAMVVWRRGEGKVFSQEELDFLIGISRQASIALQNARLERWPP
jgi:GAF domain-containing protein